MKYLFTTIIIAGLWVLSPIKAVQIFVDKDVLYNADGNAQVLSTNRVLGEAHPFRGNFGISKNPESFAA